jgi:hypothetical protein
MPMNSTRPTGHPRAAAPGRRDACCSIVYYTDSSVARGVQSAAFESIRRAAGDRELIVVAQKPDPLFCVADSVLVVGPKPRSHRSLYEQIRAGLLAAHHPLVFLVEHDVLYPEDYFAFAPPETEAVWYNRHAYVMTGRGFFACPHPLLSNACGHRDRLRLAVEQRITVLAAGARLRWAELGIGGCDSCTAGDRWSPRPTVDVRHGGNFTGPRDAPALLDRIPYWGAHHRLRVALEL